MHNRCKCGAKRREKDSMCYECRKAYNRLWQAKQRHGPSLEGYKPYLQGVKKKFDGKKLPPIEKRDG